MIPNGSVFGIGNDNTAGTSCNTYVTDNTTAPIIPTTLDKLTMQEAIDTLRNYPKKDCCTICGMRSGTCLHTSKHQLAHAQIQPAPLHSIPITGIIKGALIKDAYGNLIGRVNDFTIDPEGKIELIMDMEGLPKIKIIKKDIDT
jgi:hypothetical protein